MASFHSANVFYTLCECILYYRSKHKHKKSGFVNARILESFHEKGKKIKNENEKVANRKLREVGNLGNLGKVIPSLLISEFWILCFFPTAKIEKSDLKISEKNSEIFEISEISEFSAWPYTRNT